jgi:hypothetical protein
MTKTSLLAAGLLAALAAPAAAAPPIPGQDGYQYAAKIVCGVQEDAKNMTLARGFYATTINVHNPNPQTVQFLKRLALTVPPGGQEGGEVITVAVDVLKPDQALAADCEDIKRRVFGGSFPTPFIEGFILLNSPVSLDVTGVYSTATVRDGVADLHSGIHVEQIRERAPKTTGALPDLVVQSIVITGVSCPTGPGSCVTNARVTIANIGAANAGPFTTKSVFDPAQSVSVGSNFPAGLAMGATQLFSVATPPGQNCFDPDCTVCVTVDDGSTVTESNEGNNQLCTTLPG